ncbi:MAG TPA: hypothetical protein PLK94_00105 [Alphaproteobacteria bacterium]|nr:hypothetical protein [Alphaproteobacteria bacterium]
MMNKNHPDELKLAAYVESNLRSTERNRIEKHLTECDECRRLVSMVKELSHDFDRGAIPTASPEAQKKALNLMKNNIKKREDALSAVIKIGQKGLKLVQSQMEQVFQPILPPAQASGLYAMDAIPAYRDEVDSHLCLDTDDDSKADFETGECYRNTLSLKEPVGKYDLELAFIASSDTTFFMIIRVLDIITGNPTKGLEIILSKDERIVVAHKTEPDGRIHLGKLGIELTKGLYNIEIGGHQIRFNVAF